MSTIQQLINSVDRWYHNSSTDTDKVAWFNEAQDELSPYFGTIVEDDTLTTVANQDSYTLPTGLADVSQIIALGVATEAAPTIRYNYIKFDIITRDDYPESANVYFQTVDSTGIKKLVIQPEPSTSGYPIRIRYRKALTPLSSTLLTASPDFDSRFHNILVFYCCHAIAAYGDSPDALQADMFMQKYESAIEALWHFQLRNESKSPTKARDNKHWHKNRGYAGN